MNKKEKLAKYEAVNSKIISLHKVLYEPFERKIPGLAEPWDYKPIVEGFLHKPFANQTKAEHMVAFYLIFTFIFKDKNFKEQVQEKCLLDYKECFILLGLKYNTMLSLNELTELVEMALLSSGRIPERVRMNGCDFLFINTVISDIVPRFNVVAHAHKRVLTLMRMG